MRRVCSVCQILSIWDFSPKQNEEGTVTSVKTRKGTGCLPSPFILGLWPFLDIIFSWYLRLKPLRQDKIATINIELRCHRGRPVKLDDGSVISPGDPLIELHLNNAWFLHKKRTINSPANMIWELRSAFSEDLKYLAEQIAEGKFAPEIKAVHGMTLLDRASQRLGFTVMELPDTPWKHLRRFYLAGLMQAYHLQGARRLATGTKPLVLKELWMSRLKLLEKYRR